MAEKVDGRLGPGFVAGMTKDVQGVIRIQEVRPPRVNALSREDECGRNGEKRLVDEKKDVGRLTRILVFRGMRCEVSGGREVPRGMFSRLERRKRRIDVSFQHRCPCLEQTRRADRFSVIWSRGLCCAVLSPRFSASVQGLP